MYIKAIIKGGITIIKSYVRLFILSFILQIVFFTLLLKDESVTLLDMTVFSSTFTIVWHLTDKIFPSRKKKDIKQ